MQETTNVCKFSIRDEPEKSWNGTEMIVYTFKFAFKDKELFHLYHDRRMSVQSEKIPQNINLLFQLKVNVLQL